MGADLILQCAEIPTDVSPKWGLAKQHVERMTDEDCLETVADKYGLDVSELEEETGNTAEDCRWSILSALKEIQEVLFRKLSKIIK